MNSLLSVGNNFYKEYSRSTATRVKLIDSFIVYIIATALVQFLYCFLVGTFPFNSFLSGVISCVGVFVLTGLYNFTL